MKLLVDIHTLFWVTMDTAKLSTAAKQAWNDEANDVYVSVASAWEIAIEVGLGKWADARDLLNEFETYVELSGFDLLPISIEHARTAGLLNLTHRDPFDRLLVAQAMTEQMALVSSDTKIVGMGADIIW
jgi:PIN domain nuclease of toxin-antitoxin system